MPDLGNPLAFILGGGLSRSEEIYDAMFQSVGDGLQAGPNSIVEKWRLARARGLAAIEQDQRAMLQSFPHLSTDFLQTWEDILLEETAGVLDADQDRRDRLKDRYTRIIEASTPALEDYLSPLLPGFEITIIDPRYTRSTVSGVRAFEDFDPASDLASGPAYNVYGSSGYRKQTVAPNYADDFVLFVKFGDGPGAFTLDDQRAVLAAKDVLNEVLPAWVDFRLYISLGFTLDADLLDVTVFADGYFGA